MDDSDDLPMIVRLSCGHERALTDPETFTPHRVLAYEGGWAVKTEGSWCPACVAAGRAPKGVSWREAWDEVARRRAGTQPATSP